MLPATAMDIVEYRDVKFNGTIEHLSIHKGLPGEYSRASQSEL